MIEVALSPTTFPAQQETELTLQVRNVGNGHCKRVKLRLERPHGLLVVGGSTHVDVELLAPGERATCRFTAWADEPSRFEIELANFSYRDDRGRARHPSGPSWVLEVGPAQPRPPRERPAKGAVERTKVFISYRWSDSKERAYLLYEALWRAFGQEHVHLDQEGARLGDDFRARLDEGLRSSSAMLVLIGPDWNPERPGTGRRRLDDEDDLIRYEVDTALRAGMYLIPVMSFGAAVPNVAYLPECLRPLLGKNIAWIYPTMIPVSIKQIVDDLRPHVAGGRFR